MTGSALPGQQSQSSYRVIRRIATGGMAEVFQAETDGLAEFHKVVAIKRVLPHLTTNDKFVRMFLDEARLAARLNHRNIVQVFDVGCVDDTYFLVMEFIDGVTLRDALEFFAKRGRGIPPNIAVHIAIEICNGLDYAHTLGGRDGKPLRVVHRDISPANILLSRHGGIRITDFGLAKAASQVEKTDPGVIKGKYGYLSPETASGDEADAKADQFATGVVLWETLAGKRLFQGAGNLETVEQVRAAVVPALHAERPTVPAAVDRVLARAMARSRDERFANMGAMSRALTEILFEHRLAVTAQDVMSLVATVMGEPHEGPWKKSTPAAGTVRPDVMEQFRIKSVVQADPRLQSVVPPTQVITDTVADATETDDEPVEAEDAVSSARRIEPGARVADDEPESETVDAPTTAPTRRARWPFVALPLLAVCVGAAVAIGQGALSRRTLDAILARAGISFGRAHAVPAVRPASPPAHAATLTEARVEVLDVVAITASDAATAPTAATLPDTPTYGETVRVLTAIRARLPPCETQFGRHNRHARVGVVYDGATGNVAEATLTDRYFQQQPIGECILAAVRAETIAPFSRSRWDTSYSFLIP